MPDEESDILIRNEEWKTRSEKSQIEMECKRGKKNKSGASGYETLRVRGLLGNQLARARAR
jgi:hypothetical protein